MKVITLIALLFTAVNCFGSEKPKSSEVSFARHFAEDYLRDMSENVNELNLDLEEYTDRLFFFNDLRHHVFILMARDDYANMLNNQVLAFSIGVPHSKARETDTFMHLYNYYDKLIQDMAEGKVPKEQKSEQTRLRIQPMLYNIRWGQFHMDNVFEGQTESVLSGCGAVAVGQLMKYYEWPKTTTGEFSYNDTKHNLRTISMDGSPIEWNKINNIYLHNDFKPKALESLMKRISMALKVDYGKDFTTNWSRFIERAMVMNFGYSPGMFLIESQNVDESTMIDLIKEYLKAGRPCILSGGHHQFVCDGAFDDFIHLNMGWYGSYDGWYRFPVVRKEINTYSFIESALLNIKPQDSEGLNKTIVVEKPGTLASLLADEECANISTLKVVGKINGADIRLLRRMAGCIESENYFSWKGQLTSLDLSEATIVKDTVPYFIIDARKIRYTTSLKGTRYHFSNMTDEEWKSFCDNKGNNVPAYTITRIDTSYYINTKTMENNIGMYMFERCENLQHIILPKNTQSFSLRAFSECHCLKDITIPSGIRTLPNSCFADCTSLESIKVCSDSPLLELRNMLKESANNNVFANCNPNIRMDIDNSLETYTACRERQQEEFRKAHPATVTPTQSDNVPAKKRKLSKLQTIPMGAKLVSHYKMVNGKRVLVGQEVK